MTYEESAKKQEDYAKRRKAYTDLWREKIKTEPEEIVPNQLELEIPHDN